MNYVSDIGFTYRKNNKLQIDLCRGIDLVKPGGNFYFDCRSSYKV
jgi:hypothetical protein